MNFNKIKSLQKQYGFDTTQKMINDGSIWKLQGSAGREAMSTLECGACMLPKLDKYDYYGNLVPSRDRLKKGTKGTYQNSLGFWQGVEDGEIFLELN